MNQDKLHRDPAATVMSRAVRIACAFAALAPAAAALAQTTPSTGVTPSISVDDGTALDAVTVTVRKREERGQDVPQSMNVFSGAALENSGITQMEEMQFRTPGLKVVNALGAASLSIRGISNNASPRGGSASTAVHLDGVYLPRPILALGEVFGAFAG